MPAKSGNSQACCGNLLGLTSIPLHFCERPDAWPWEIEVIDLPAMHRKIDMPQVSLEETLRLLVDLVDASLKVGTENMENLPPVITLTEKEIRLRLRFAQRIGKLTPVERLGCCGNNKVGVRLVDGRPLLLDPWHEGELLFGDGPIAWIRNGLHAIDRRVLSSPLPPIRTSDLLPCPALTIQPCELPGGRKITNPTIPALYIGLRPVNRVIDDWRATFWFRDIRDGYALAGERLQECWLQRIPSTSEPDPIYRFIREPSERLRDEALTFLRHAHDKRRKRAEPGGSERPEQGAKLAATTRPDRRTPAPTGKQKEQWYHKSDEEPPAKFKFGPLPGFKKEFAEVCFERRMDHRPFANACTGKDACFWVKKLAPFVNKYPYKLWFQAENDLKAAMQRLDALRKLKAKSDIVERKAVNDSTEPTSD